jgi:iron complex outermembrane receptor protein
MRFCARSLLCLLAAPAFLHAREAGDEAIPEGRDTLRTVQVTATRRLRDTGLQITRLDTLALRENISLSVADVLTQHSTLYIKSYGRAT